MTKIQLRRDTLANFTSVNPVLAEGEMAYETDTKKFKIGDGATTYANLDYQAHVVYLTRAEYDALTTKDTTTLYIITDEEGGGSSGGGTTITKGDTTYTTLALGDNLVVTDGVVNVNLDEIGSELSDLSTRVTSIENNKQNKFSAVAPLYLQEKGSLPLTGVGDVTILPTTALQPCGTSIVNLNNARGVFRLNLGTGNRKIWLANTAIGLHVYGNFSGHSAQFYLKVRTGSGLADAISKVIDNNTRIYSEDIIVTISSISRTQKLQVAYASDPDTLIVDESIFYNSNTVASTSPYPYVEAGDVTIYKEGLTFATGSDTTLQLSLNETIPTKTSELTNDSGFVTIDSSPILDVPVNNCVLAMPTVPTFDGTNVTVYAGTKVAIPNGRESGSYIPKVNIVTLTSDATINQSTYNGKVTLMLKSDGTIDQTAYPYNIVDDINKVTPTAYNWYYCRYSNRHYLASSTGTLTPYQRFKIGEYNQAEAATEKYFKVRFPIGFPPDNEFIDVTPAS